MQVKSSKFVEAIRGHSNPDQWAVINPFAEEASCQHGLKGELTDFQEKFRTQQLRGKVVDTAIFLENKAGQAQEIIQYRCWPDTVDPRPR